VIAWSDWGERHGWGGEGSRERAAASVPPILGFFGRILGRLSALSTYFP